MYQPTPIPIRSCDSCPCDNDGINDGIKIRPALIVCTCPCHWGLDVHVHLRAVLRCWPNELRQVMNAEELGKVLDAERCNRGSG